MFKQGKWAQVASATLLVGMLAGCGAASDGNSINQGINAEQTGSGTDGSVSGGEVSDGMQEDQAADFIGKVVSVSAESIVLQKSTMQPANIPEGGQTFGRGMRRGAGEGSENPERTGKPQDGRGNSEERPQSSANDQQEGQRPSERGAGGRGFPGEMDWTDEQITVRIGEETELLTTLFGESGMTTTPLQLSDLQAGDVLTVWLANDETTNEQMGEKTDAQANTQTNTQTNTQANEPIAEKIMKRQMPTNREGVGGRQ